MTSHITSFGGWLVHLQAEVQPEERGYDQPQATYDGTSVYDSEVTSWITLDCQLMSVTAEHGGRLEQIPGVRAQAGSLTAELYDPDRLLDPKVSPYALLARPGAPVRLVAVEPVTGDVVPLWTGEAEEFTHDLKEGTGRLVARDLVTRLSGVNTAEWARPTESSQARYAAINAMPTKPLPFTFAGTTSTVCASKIAGDLWNSGIVKVAETEQAVVWVDQAGTLRRRDLDSGWGDMWLCGDCDTGTEALIYTRLTSTVSLDLLANIVLTERVSIGDTDRPLRQRSNVTSINWHGAASLTYADLQLVDDAQLALWSQRVLDLRANPRPIVTGMAVEVSNLMPWAGRTVPNMARIEVGRALDIRLASRGTASRWLMITAGIRHSITPGTWLIELELADGTPALSTTSRYLYDDAAALYDVSKYDVTTVTTPIPVGV